MPLANAGSSCPPPPPAPCPLYSNAVFSPGSTGDTGLTRTHSTQQQYTTRMYGIFSGRAFPAPATSPAPAFLFECQDGGNFPTDAPPGLKYCTITSSRLIYSGVAAIFAATSVFPHPWMFRIVCTIQSTFFLFASVLGTAVGLLFSRVFGIFRCLRQPSCTPSSPRSC